LSDQYWSWIVTIIGLIGFYLAGRKIWWSWYINIANQLLWTIFAVATEQWGFLLGVPLYLFVFIKNAYSWTKEHYESPSMKMVRLFNESPIAPVSHIRRMDTNQPICEVPDDVLLGFVKLDPSDTAPSCTDCTQRSKREGEKRSFPRKKGSW
jgi:hypothetical protein